MNASGIGLLGLLLVGVLLGLAAAFLIREIVRGVARYLKNWHDIEKNLAAAEKTQKERWFW